MSLLEHFERLVMPDTEAVGWFAGLRRVVGRTVVDTFDDHVPGLAAEMAFFVVLSLPPLLLAVLGSLGFVVGNLPADDLDRLQSEILSISSTFLSESTVDDVLRAPVENLLREGRSDILSLGILLTLWSASRATNVLLRTVTVAYDLVDNRPGWKRRGLAITITIAGIVVVVGVLPLMVLGPQLLESALEAAGLGASLLRFWSFAYWGGVLVIGVVALTWLYHVAPGWYTPWRRDLPGALLALVIWLLASWGLRVYTSQLAGFTADDAFRGLAAPLILLLWIYVSAIAVLVGAELNAEIERIWPSEEGPYDEPQERI